MNESSSELCLSESDRSGNIFSFEISRIDNNNNNNNHLYRASAATVKNAFEINFPTGYIISMRAKHLDSEQISGPESFGKCIRSLYTLRVELNYLSYLSIRFK